MTTDLVTRKTVEELVTAWNLGIHELRNALAAIKRCEEHLKAFDGPGYCFQLQPFNCNDYSTDYDRKYKRLKAAAWAYLVDRIELKKMASIARAKEIDKQLHEKPETLPDITMDNVFGWLEAMAQQGRTFLEEAAIEVYNKLRPYRNNYKTNSAFKIGEKVILAYRLENVWSGKGFRVNYHYADELRALDNVFHLLDGKSLSAYRQGDLAIAIEEAKSGVGETEFFQFKCYKNQNLHLKFKRMDLVERLNMIGGNALPDPNRD
jgi:hypothetical protein